MRLLVALYVVLLSACAVIFPIPHDAVMFDQIVSIQIETSKISCSDKNWNVLLDKVNHLKVYTELRKDPQAKSIAQLQEALLKANTSKSEKFCESIIRLQKTRIEVVEDAWKGR